MSYLFIDLILLSYTHIDTHIKLPGLDLLASGHVILSTVREQTWLSSLTVGVHTHTHERTHNSTHTQIHTNTDYVYVCNYNRRFCFLICHIVQRKVLRTRWISFKHTHARTHACSAFWPSVTWWSLLSVVALCCEFPNQSSEARKPPRPQPKTSFLVCVCVFVVCFHHKHCVDPSLFWKAQINDDFWLCKQELTASNSETEPKVCCLLFLHHCVHYGLVH